jgi:hypothetical protein
MRHSLKNKHYRNLKLSHSFWHNSRTDHSLLHVQKQNTQILIWLSNLEKKHSHTHQIVSKRSVMTLLLITNNYSDTKTTKYCRRRSYINVNGFNASTRQSFGINLDSGFFMIFKFLWRFSEQWTFGGARGNYLVIAFRYKMILCKLKKLTKESF